FEHLQVDTHVCAGSADRTALRSLRVTHGCATRAVDCCTASCGDRTHEKVTVDQFCRYFAGYFTCFPCSSPPGGYILRSASRLSGGSARVARGAGGARRCACRLGCRRRGAPV